MKLTFGRNSRPRPAIRGIDWRTLRQPDEELALVLAIPIGTSLATTVLVLWILATPWTNIVADEWSLLSAFVVAVTAHEIAHALAFPWLPAPPWIALELSRTAFALHAGYDHELSRARLLWVQSAPLVFVSLLPLALSAAFGTAPPLVALVTLLNALLSGADVLSMLLVLGQVPPGCRMLARASDLSWQLRGPDPLGMLPAWRDGVR
jgi:Putative zincin peptidase